MPDKTSIWLPPSDAALLFFDTLRAENPRCEVKVLESYGPEKCWVYSVSRKDGDEKKEVVICIEWKVFRYKRVMISMCAMHENRREYFEKVSDLLDYVYKILNFVH